MYAMVSLLVNYLQTRFRIRIRRVFIGPNVAYQPALKLLCGGEIQTAGLLDASLMQRQLDPHFIYFFLSCVEGEQQFPQILAPRRQLNTWVGVKV